MQLAKYCITLLLVALLFSACQSKGKVPTELANKKFYEVKLIGGQYFLPTIGRRVLVSTTDTHVKIHNDGLFDAKVLSFDETPSTTILYFDLPNNKYGINRTYTVSHLNATTGLQKWAYCYFDDDSPDWTFHVVDESKIDMMHAWDNKLPAELQGARFYELKNTNGEWWLSDQSFEKALVTGQVEVNYWGVNRKVDFVEPTTIGAGIQLHNSEYLDSSHIPQRANDRVLLSLEKDIDIKGKWNLSILSKIKGDTIHQRHLVRASDLNIQKGKSDTGLPWVKKYSDAYRIYYHDLRLRYANSIDSLNASLTIFDPRHWHDMLYEVGSLRLTTTFDYNNDGVDDPVLVSYAPIEYAMGGCTIYVDILESQKDKTYKWVAAPSFYINYYTSVIPSVTSSDSQFNIILDNAELGEKKTYTWKRNAQGTWDFAETISEHGDLLEDDSSLQPLHLQNQHLPFATPERDEDDDEEH